MAKKKSREYIISVIRACILCVAMLMPTLVWATHPFTVKDTYTEGKGNYLFELTGDYAKDDSYKTTTNTAYITAGAARHTDLSLEIPFVLLDPSAVTGAYERGIGDLRFNVKHQIFENEVRQSMAYEFFATLPTGDVEKGLGTNNIFWGFRLMDTQECHNNAFHLNVSYEMSGRDLKQFDFANRYNIKFGLSVEHKFTNSFRLVSEITGENQGDGEGGTSRPYRFVLGTIYDISKTWYVDFGARAGLNKDAEDYSLSAGTAWRF